MDLVNICILAGDGLNCELETMVALNTELTNPQIIHLNDFINQKYHLSDFDILALPGGFSYGDDLGSAAILSHKIRKYLLTDLETFINAKKPVIGICNGFQVLLKLNIFGEGFKSFGLIQNKTNKFHNEISELKVEKSNCIWSKDIGDSTFMISRHGEGRFFSSEERKSDILLGLSKSSQVVFRYKNNFNGSDDAIAGICNSMGNVLGLMPHPEVEINESHIKQSCYKELFSNAINYSFKRGQI